MSGISICDIEFEKWATLASTDPLSFEQLRQDKLAACIERATGERQQRLRCLQWRIDQIRNQNKDSAMAACLAISELMWDTFQHLSEVLHNQGENGLNSPAPLAAADIIPFPSTS